MLSCCLWQGLLELGKVRAWERLPREMSSAWGREGQGSWVMLCDLREPGRAQCWDWCRGALAAGVFGWIYLSVFLSQGAIPSLQSLRWDTKLGWGTWKHVVLHPM